MTVPFSTALTAAPSAASILMPVPLDAAKSTSTRPLTGQRNLSLPDMTGSAAGALAISTGWAATGAGVAAGAVLACSVLGAACGKVCWAGAAAAVLSVDASLMVGALLASRSERPGMMTF